MKVDLCINDKEVIMFGERKSSTSVPAKAIKTSSKKNDAAVTILTAGCHFTGKLYCRGSSRIAGEIEGQVISCLLYTSPSPRDATLSRMPSSA